MTRYFMIILVIILVFSGCHRNETDDQTSKSALRLYVFNCGMLRLGSIEAFSLSDEETDIRDMIVPCYIIEHENGRLLWDGGLASATAEKEGWQGEGILLRLDRTFNEQLADIGLDMSSFDFMAYSHMHFDHIGVANEVKGATLIIQKAEYDVAFADNVDLPGFIPALYENLKNAEQIVLEGDYDVFGDGRVRILSTPGHTPGHQVLFVDLENTGPVVLSGDLYHFAISRQERRVPTFNFDAEATLESMDRVEAFLTQTGAKLWIEHELAWFEQQKKAPSFYD